MFACKQKNQRKCNRNIRAVDSYIYTEGKHYVTVSHIRHTRDIKVTQTVVDSHMVS